MPTTVDRMTKVPEADLVGLMNDFREIDEADIVTAFVDNEGTFTVEFDGHRRRPPDGSAWDADSQSWQDVALWRSE